ncbi:hypothetical protein KSS87_001626 [Heliosperma pusillum]|nr:hypothetical protein KSS87_001626 [Heliosperma pusillum]
MNTGKGKKRKQKSEESVADNFFSANSIIKTMLTINNCVARSRFLDTLPSVFLRYITQNDQFNDDLQMDYQKLEILKKVLFLYSTGKSRAPKGNYWSISFWTCILDEYNEKVPQESLILQNYDDLLKLGKELHFTYCRTRRSTEADETLNKIFDPCPLCHLRCISIPSRKGKQVSREFTLDELKVLKQVFLDYANCNLQVQIVRGDYRSPLFWTAILDTYNSRCPRSLSRDKSDDMILGGHKLLHDFNTTRTLGFIPQDLKSIFECCEECRNRIPVFPTTLMTSQNGSSSYTTENSSYRAGNSRNSSYGEEPYFSPNSLHSVVDITKSLQYVDRTNERNLSTSTKVIDALAKLVKEGHITEPEAVAGVILCAPTWDIHVVATLLSSTVSLTMKRDVVLPSIKKAMKKAEAEEKAEADAEKFAAMAKGNARVRSTQ